MNKTKVVLLLIACTLIMSCTQGVSNTTKQAIESKITSMRPNHPIEFNSITKVTKAEALVSMYNLVESEKDIFPDYKLIQARFKEKIENLEGSGDMLFYKVLAYADGKPVTFIMDEAYNLKTIDSL